MDFSRLFFHQFAHGKASKAQAIWQHFKFSFLGHPWNQKPTNIHSFFKQYFSVYENKVLQLMLVWLCKILWKYLVFINWRSCKHCFKNEWILVGIWFQGSPRKEDLKCYHIAWPVETLVWANWWKKILLHNVSGYLILHIRFLVLNLWKSVQVFNTWKNVHRR